MPKEYDIFYSCQGGEWNDYARNWTLAKASFKRLITELNIKVLSKPFCFSRVQVKVVHAREQCLHTSVQQSQWG